MKAAAAAAAASAQHRNDPKYLLMLTVSPGRLGLTLEMMKEEGEGAIIKAIDPACTFLGQVEVGDRILTIDGEMVTKLEDLLVGKDRLRKFGILKKPRKPTFPIPTDRLKDRKKMADLIQHDKRKNIAVSLTGIIFLVFEFQRNTHTNNIYFATFCLDPSSNEQYSISSPLRPPQPK